jgi:hypothetical protein
MTRDADRVGRHLMRRRTAATPVFDEVDAWLDRLQLVDEDDETIAKFLDSLDLRGPRERQMLAELARKGPLRKPDQFASTHRSVVAALETLGRHGYHAPRLPRWLRPRFLPRFLVELVARYVVVSHLRRVAIELRNLYWLRAMQAAPGTPERPLLRRARAEAEGLIVVFSRRELGLPSFVIGGLLVPLTLTLLRLSSSVSFVSWWATTIAAVVGGLVVLAASWVILRGTAMASRRIRLATQGPLNALWETVGWCGHPPRDQSRKFTVIAIVLTTVAWLALPVVIAIAIVT